MIAFAKPLQRENRWYVVIALEKDSHYRWDAGVEENFQVYCEFAKRHCYRISAKESGLTDTEMDKITGCNSRGEEINTKYLENLVRRLNAGAKINPQKALTRLRQRCS